MFPSSLALFVKSSLWVIFTQPLALVLSYVTTNRSMATNIGESIVRGINGLLMTSKKAFVTSGYTSHTFLADVFPRPWNVKVVSAIALLCPRVPAYTHAVNQQVLEVFACAKHNPDLQLGLEQQ